jgi:hypothetical protein
LSSFNGYTWFIINVKYLNYTIQRVLMYIHIYADIYIYIHKTSSQSHHYKIMTTTITQNSKICLIYFVLFPSHSSLPIPSTSNKIYFGEIYFVFSGILSKCAYRESWLINQFLFYFFSFHHFFTLLCFSLE